MTSHEPGEMAAGLFFPSDGAFEGGPEISGRKQKSRLLKNFLQGLMGLVYIYLYI